MSEYSQDPTERKSQPLYLKLKSDLMYFCYSCNEDNMDFKFSDLESSNRNWNFIAIGAECRGIKGNVAENSNWLVGVSQVNRYTSDSTDTCQPYFVDVRLMKLGLPRSNENLKIYTIEDEDILVDILERNKKEYYANDLHDAKPEEVIELMKTLYDLSSPKDTNLQLRKITQQSHDVLVRQHSNEIYAFLNLCDSKSYPTNKQVMDDVKNRISQYFGSTIGKMLGFREQ